MNSVRVVFLLVLAGAGLATGGLLLIGGHRTTPTAGPVAGPPASPPADAVDVVVANATTKQRWLDEVAARFNAAGRRTGSGRLIRIVVKPVLSGGSLRDIVERKLEPAAWSPGTSSWVQELDEQWRQRTGDTLESQPCRPTIRTPLGIAMWRPMAEALGWPGRPVRWRTIIELAADPRGWEALGHPEWGRFRLGYPHPGYSNVGMLFLTAVAYGVKGKTAGLEPAEIYGADVREALAALARNTTKYGMISLDLLDAMARHGPQFLHAVAAFENDTVQYNLDKAAQLRFPLAFVVPADGTFWADQPYCVFDKAAWVTPDQAEGARLFLADLLQGEQQVLAMKSLLRPLDDALPLAAPLDLAHGTDPTVGPRTVPTLAAPGAGAMRALADLFLITKRKATVLVVLDVSGSMQGDKIRTATAATASFLGRLQPDDIVGLQTFNDTVRTILPPRPAAEVVEGLARTVANLIAEGGTALYAGTCQAMKTMGELRRRNEAAGINRLYGIVLLSDGNDTAGGVTENQMMATCLPADPEATGIRIFPIAFGSDANAALLARIADATGGRMFQADTESIERAYLSVSAEQ